MWRRHTTLAHPPVASSSPPLRQSPRGAEAVADLLDRYLARGGSRFDHFGVSDAGATVKGAQ
jgi:hypothetical protein